jgi:hypothetical protein
VGEGMLVQLVLELGAGLLECGVLQDAELLLVRSVGR